MENPPFGHYALPMWREGLRRLAGGSRKGSVRRILTSMARRAALLNQPDPFDLEIFDSQKARLYPRDNLCEKRVFAHPDSWDQEERRRISRMIADKAQSETFVFVDVGANVGLYTLFALASARTSGQQIKVVAVEPDPVNRQRLYFNLKASRARDRVSIVAKAIGADEKSGHLIFPGENRGKVRLVTKEELALLDKNTDDLIKVDINSLEQVLLDEGLQYVDLMKIDIEGGEPDVLHAFFAHADKAFFPRWMVLETIGESGVRALEICHRAGYEVATQTRMNAVLELPEDKNKR